MLESESLIQSSNTQWDFFGAINWAVKCKNKKIKANKKFHIPLQFFLWAFIKKESRVLLLFQKKNLILNQEEWGWRWNKKCRLFKWYYHICESYMCVPLIFWDNIQKLMWKNVCIWWKCSSTYYHIIILNKVLNLYHKKKIPYHHCFYSAKNRVIVKTKNRKQEWWK